MPELTSEQLVIIVSLTTGVAVKGLDLAVSVVKDKLNGKGSQSESEALKLARQSLAQSQANGRDLAKLKETVIEGNGRLPLTTQIALLDQAINSHTNNQNLHVKGGGRGKK